MDATESTAQRRRIKAIKANTAVTIIKDGSDVTTATHLDISVTFVIE